METGARGEPVPSGLTGVHLQQDRAGCLTHDGQTVFTGAPLKLSLNAYTPNVSGPTAPVPSPSVEKCANPDPRPEALRETHTATDTFSLLQQMVTVPRATSKSGQQSRNCCQSREE
ncbi:unnamed protein product [Pleuronectes platessa]|uniref:Uncharacterized protein n=1 Tax=Pleuronectes platessa TaxID=8262 RepID=A0A9N7VZS4_PLEPL|nr:unnamed protein product [Pleuronectes platessa]